MCKMVKMLCEMFKMLCDMFKMLCEMVKTSCKMANMQFKLVEIPWRARCRVFKTNGNNLDSPEIWCICTRKPTSGWKIWTRELKPPSCLTTRWDYAGCSVCTLTQISQIRQKWKADTEHILTPGAKFIFFALIGINTIQQFGQVVRFVSWIA